MRDPRMLVGLLISVVATILLVYVVNPSEVLVVLQRSDPFAVAAGVATIVGAMWTKAARWRLLFPEPGGIRHRGLHESLYVGYMVNAILPLRMGEVVRAFLAAQMERVNTSTTLATVLIEKVLDVGTMALLLFVLSLIFPELPETARYAAQLSGLGLLAAIGGIAFALSARGVALKLTGSLERRLPRLGSIGVTNLLGSFLDGLTFARRPVVLAQVAAWTIVHWSLSACSVGFALLAVGIDGASPHQLLQMSLLVMVATNLSMAIPSAPGYVGVFHGIFVATLSLFGVQEDRATAAAVIEHAVVFGTFIVGGGYFLARGETLRIRGRGLAELVSRARSVNAGTTR